MNASYLIMVNNMESNLRYVNVNRSETETRVQVFSINYKRDQERRPAGPNRFQTRPKEETTWSPIVAPILVSQSNYIQFFRYIPQNKNPIDNKRKIMIYIEFGFENYISYGKVLLGRIW